MKSQIDQKLKIALEAINGKKKRKDLAKEYGLKPKEITKLVKKLYEEGNKIFREKSSKPTAEEILKLTADTLESEFRKARIITHYPTSGKQAEDLLMAFLNKHLPKRFAATTGFAIDIENNISQQSDILLYDALNSPLFPVSMDSQMILVDHLVAVIEVKSNLTLAQLQDAACKIASVKTLKQDADIRQSKADSCLGIVFAYESKMRLENIAKNLDNLNSARPRVEWIDTIVVLGKGMISYTLQLPNENKSSMFIVSKNFLPPAGFINLSIFSNPEYPLNLFISKLMGEIGIFIGHSILSNNIILKAISASKIYKRYVFDADQKIIALKDATLDQQCMFDVFEYAHLVGRYTIYKWANGFIFHTMQSKNSYDFLDCLIKILRPQRFTFIEGLSSNNLFAYTTILKGKIPTAEEISQVTKNLGLRVEFRS